VRSWNISVLPVHWNSLCHADPGDEMDLRVLAIHVDKCFHLLLVDR